MSIKNKMLFLAGMFACQVAAGQSAVDSVQLKKEYTRLEDALKEPEKVYRLDLSNQDVRFSPEFWSKFTNLQYLSLRNDHLKAVPKEIANLKNLRVLDLSGNDFTVLPDELGGLPNLQELYLNEDRNLLLEKNLEKNMDVLSRLPRLRSLHLENADLRTLPASIQKLEHLEMLYLNRNNFRSVPEQVKGLKHLRYLDLKDNRVRQPSQIPEGFGIRINF